MWINFREFWLFLANAQKLVFAKFLFFFSPRKLIYVKLSYQNLFL